MFHLPLLRVTYSLVEYSFSSVSLIIRPPIISFSDNFFIYDKKVSTLFHRYLLVAKALYFNLLLFPPSRKVLIPHCTPSRTLLTPYLSTLSRTYWVDFSCLNVLSLLSTRPPCYLFGNFSSHFGNKGHGSH